MAIRKRKRSSKKTIKLCHFRHPDGQCCANEVKWRLEVIKSGVLFCVCAEHIYWGLTFAGTPAQMKVREKTVKIKTVDS